MQITNAAERLAESLEAKARRPWNPDLHPRDSKGRFVETGGIARLWGGGMARVLRALGGRNVLVENLSTRQRSTISAARLTMVARPDGTAPTRSKMKVRDEDERRQTDGRRGTGLDAEDTGDDGDTPDDPHDQDDEGNEIGEDRDGEDRGAGPEPEDDEPEDQAPPKATRRRDPKRRFKTLDDVRAHWASGKLRQYDTDSDRQEGHNKRMAGFMDELGKPQLSRNGHFVVGQMQLGSKTVWGVTHSDTGIRFTATDRKGEALDFANRMEDAHLDGKPLDWNSPEAFDQINTPEGRKLAGQMAAESRKAFAERAAKKRASATSRTTPAAPTTPEQQAAQQIADRTGVPAGNIAVGHVGAPQAPAGDERGRPRNDAELRAFWKRGGAHASARKEHRKSQADALRRMADNPNLRISLADHRGFAIVEDTSRDDDYRFTVMTSGSGRQLSGLGPRRLMSYGNFADRDTANRFALYLGSTLRHDEDGRTVDWGDPNVSEELSRFRDKDGQDSHRAIWKLAGQFDRERGVSDSPAARFGRPADERDEQQRNDSQAAPGTSESRIPGEDETPQPAEGQQRDEQEEQNRGERLQGAGEGVLADVPADGSGRSGADDAAGDVLRADGGGDRGADSREAGRVPGGDGARGGLQGRDGVDQHGDDEVQGSGPARTGVQPGEGAGDGERRDAEGEPAEDRSRVAFGSDAEERRAPQYQPPEDGRSLVPSSVLARVKANIAAIEALRRLQDEDRPATAAEQETLARWSGWGATPQVFVDSPKPEFAPLQERLRELLSEAEWDAAKENTLNAHYTDPDITRAVWDAVKELGFDGGSVLEPGSGSGNFIGYAPESAHMTGVELDPITAGISKALYPHANIRNEGFEKTRAADGTFDLTVGNVPFGDYQVVDLRHNKGGHNIHNHFILKSLDLTRPGGLVAVVTSRYTMDGSTPRAEDARMEMARKGDLVGAIRLPTGAHRRTAGTDVVTDLLIFRRREKDKEFTSGRLRNGQVKAPDQRKKDDPPLWVHAARVTDLPGQDPDEADKPETPKVHVNPYFLTNPNNVLGEMAVGHGMYGPGELRVDGDGTLDTSLGKALKKAVARAKDAGLSYTPDDGDRRRPEMLPEGSNRTDGHVQVSPDGTFTQVKDGMVVPYNIPSTQQEEATQLLDLRDAMKALIAEESRPDADDALIETLRGDLKARYDAYHAKFGSLNRFEWSKRKATDPETGQQVEKAFRKRPPMGGLITKDPTMAVVLSLDTYDDTTKTSTPAAIFSKRQSRHRTIADRASNPEDAMAIVMEQKGTLDTNTLAQVMGVTPQVARERLLAARSTDPETGDEYPLVFEPHSGGDLVPAADYLSGNVRARLEEAQALAADDSRFDINVKQLEAVLPPDITPGEIDAPMGAAWLGGDIVQAFLRDKLNSDTVRVSYQGGSLWKVDAPDGVKKGQAATRVWGTNDYPAIKLAEAILTNGRIRVTYRTETGTYVDEDATAAAQTKADELKEEFQDWLWRNPDRSQRIKKLYNDTHNNLALRSYDGQRRTMPGLATWFIPHAHQHSAVARMVNEPAVLLAHEVGAGKTAEMTMGVMELRRLGLINKASIVVPNHMLQQFTDEFAELYPESAAAGRILSASSEDLQGRKRREFIARVATGDYDAVILTQNAFESIPMRPEVQLDYIKREKKHLEEALRRQKDQNDLDNPGKSRDSRMVKEIQKRLKNLEAKITAKIEASKDTAGLYFEDTGIDYVVVDEAHHYKNLATNSGIPGAGIEGSNRASDLDMKLEYLRKNTKSGRVVTFSTATPISNSVTEAHTMLRYLRPDLLEAARVRDFDEFASTYGKIVSGVELAADGSGFKEVSRFAAFRNMPELLRIWKTVADVKTSEDLAEYLDTPDISGGKAITVSVEPTEQMLAYQDQLAARARAVKTGQVDPRKDNMLKISSDGRKVSLDPRMVGLDEQGHKLPRAAENIARIYEETKGAVYPTSKNDLTPHDTPGGLQIVFLDMGTPKDPGKAKKKGKNDGPTSVEELADSPFPAYQELKELLISQGVPAEKIRFIHEAKNDAEKARLFADARTGKIAVLVGSTAKMGTGTNVQLRATALHHLDCPWRPADLEQRNGRIIRQGNFNPEVAIFQYVTEQSFDGFSWQTVARKAKFIRQLMKGNLTDRTVEDIPDGVFNAEQVTAISTGNPYLLEQANVKASLAVLKRKLKGHERTVEGYKTTIHAAERLRQETDKLVAQLQNVIARRKNTRGDAFNATIGNSDFAKRDEAAKALSTAAQAVLRQGQKDPYKSGGHPKIVIGRVGNIEVTAQYRTAWGDYGRIHLVDISYPDIPRSRHSYQEDDLKKDSTLPITRLEDSLADVDKVIVRSESNLRQEERAADTARERVDRPFEHSKELDAAERRSRLVGALIREQGKQTTSEEAGREKRSRLEGLEHQLREARIAAGEDSGDVDDPAAAQDTDLLPRTPAPPSISTDSKGRPRVLWPDAEAKKAAKDRAKKAKAQKAREDRGETTLDPAQVRSDLEGLSEDAPAADNDEQEQNEEESTAPVPDQQETTDSTDGDVTLDPAQVRSDLDDLQPDSSEESNEPESAEDETAQPAPEGESAKPEEEQTPEQEPETTEQPETTEEPEAAAQRNTDSGASPNRAPRTRTSGDDGVNESGAARAPRPADERTPRSAPSARPEPEPQAAPTDMTAEQLGDAIDEVENQLSPLAESADPLDLAMRRRLERRLWELEDEERRRWKPEPKYDDNGRPVGPSRGDTVQDRLGGYGLNDAEVQGLVARVEDLPEAKEGGYSDEEWERISAEASAREDYPPTDEQNIIIEGAARRGLNMAVMALAGTGKSSTLKMLSHRMPGKKIVYLAFNRSVAAEAREAQTRGEYAKNMLASTANAYAARVADRRLNDRLPSSKAGGFKKLSAQQIADRMRWHDTVKAGNRDLVPGGAATVAERMLREWAKSADAEMGPQHVRANTEGERRDLFNAVKPLADRMWANLSDPEAGDPDADLTMDFDYIVKQWALGGYKLDADTLFWDEAQDVNPVMEGVVRAALDQRVQVVAVGDSNQAIYGFRGASDALAKLPVDARATLTQSFRFGPAVADVGNRFLRLLGTRMRLKGFDRKNSRIEQLPPGEESMVIARTNAGVALAAVQALTAGRTVAVSGGVKALQEFVQAAHALAEGEDTDHAELARFNGMAFDDIVEEVKTDPDLQQLASLFNLLEKHGDDIDALLSSGSRPAATELVGDRVWVRLDWNDPNANDLKRWLGDGKTNGVGKLLYDPATRRYYYEPGKREVPWKTKTRSGVHKIDNKLSLEEAQQAIEAHLTKLYPQDDTEDGNGRLVHEHEPHDMLVTTAHKAKGLESERVRIADDFKGPKDNDNGNIDWDTVPDDEALRVAYVAVTRATEVLDPGSLGWVFRAVNNDDPTQPPKGEYRRDFKLDDFQTGDQVDFEDEDGTPNIGTVSEIDPPTLAVVTTNDEPGMGGKRQEIGPAQVRRRNGQPRPLLPAATDAELDQAIAEGRYGSEHIDPQTGERAPGADEPRTVSDDEAAVPEQNTEEPGEEPAPDNSPEIQVPDLPGLDLSEYTANDQKDADAYRSWAGVWANPAPDGPRNALLDRVANMPGSAYRPLHPENASTWISIAGDVAPFAQFEENTRHLLSQYGGGQADFLAGRAASLRDAAQRIAENFRADSRKIMQENIATRDGTKKATAKLEERWSDALERIRQVVPDQIAAALADAERHGLTEQQLKNFLGGISGGDDPDQNANGLGGSFPEVRRTLHSARRDVLAYFTGFRAWRGVDDQGFDGHHHYNSKRRELGGSPVPSGAAGEAGGDLIIGESQLPDGMRWARLQSLQPGDFYRSVQGRREDSRVFDGASVPQYVIHLHADGREGYLRTTSLSDGTSTGRPGDWVIQLTSPEPALRKRASTVVRNDRFLAWVLPDDEKQWEAAQALSRRPDGDAANLSSLEEGEHVRVRGGESSGGVYVAEGTVTQAPERARMWRNGEEVDGWRLHLSSGRHPGDHIYIADGNEDEWAERLSPAETNDDSSDEPGVPARDEPDRDEVRPEDDEGNNRADRGRSDRDRDSQDAPAPDSDGLDGGARAPEGDDERREREGQERGSDDGEDDERSRSRRRRRRDRDRGGRDGGAPDDGLPDGPDLPERDENDDAGDTPSGSEGGPEGGDRLAELKDRYRNGSVPTPDGADPDEHNAYLRRLADNESLTLSPGGGLIVWSDDGRLWQVGHAGSGMHLPHFGAYGEEIGGRDGVVHLAGEYERMLGEDGQPIDWAQPQLDVPALRQWRDARGEPLTDAISFVRQAMLREHRQNPAGREQAGVEAPSPAAEPEPNVSPDAAPSRAEPDSPNDGSGVSSPSEASDSDTGAAVTPDAPLTGSGADAGDAEKPRAGDGAPNGDPELDIRPFMSGEDWDGRIVSDDAAVRRFGSVERMRELASRATLPSPQLPTDHESEVWLNGRLVGSVNDLDNYNRTLYPALYEGMWQATPEFFPTLSEPVFRSREAAIAEVVLRALKAGPPDHAQVTKEMASDFKLWHELHFPKSVDDQNFGDDDRARYEALSKHLTELAAGRAPSGNLAADLGHAVDELDWLDDRYHKGKDEDFHINPGALSRDFAKVLDHVRPEDPRAAHHRERQYRAAIQALRDLETDGVLDRTPTVPVAELRDGDVVLELAGRRATGSLGVKTGYLRGAPKKARVTRGGERVPVYRVRIGDTPWEDGGREEIFTVPVDALAHRFGSLDDVEIREDQQDYGLGVGQQAPEHTFDPQKDGIDYDGRARAQADRMNTLTPADEGDRAESGSATAETGAAAPADTTADTSVSEPETEPRAAEPNGSTPAGRTVDEMPGAGAPATEPQGAPDPIGGRPAEWVKISDIAHGDLVRVDGVTKQGTARTLAGYVVGGPEPIPTSRNRRTGDMYRVLIADTPDGKGAPVWVMPDAAAARSTREDSDHVEGAPSTGADADVLTGRVADRVPTDSAGNGIFPGSVVTDSEGNDGVVTGASATSVRAQFGDSRSEEDHSPTSLNVTDGGAGRPAGWTADGHRVQPGNVVGEQDGTRLGTVEEVDGDSATVARPGGMDERPIGTLRVIGDTADHESSHKVAVVEPAAATEVEEGDVLVRETPAGPRTARVTGRHEDGEQTGLDLEDTTTDKADSVSVPSGGTVLRARDAEGNAPDLGPEDGPPDNAEITSHEPLPPVAPVTGPTVDPQLSPEERATIADRTGSPTADPDAEEGAARLVNDLPVTPAQATALADDLREGADSGTPEGRAAQRAARRLDAAADPGSDDTADATPEPGTVGTVGVGDTITLPDEFAPDTMTAYRVVDIQDGPGGVRSLTVEDGDGQRFKRTLASSDPLYQLPEPEAPADDTDAEPRDPNPAPDPERLRNDYHDSVVRAVIDSALQGTTTPGSVHQLREQIAQRLTPEALRTPMRRARNGALASITDAGFAEDERQTLVGSLRTAASKARRDAIRAALRTLDDFEAHDGESEEDMARRAADALRLIPDALRNRPEASDDTDGAPHVNDAVNGHVGNAVGDALQAAADDGPLTEERRAAIVAQLAARMAANRDAAARQIAAGAPAGQRPGLLAHIIAGLVLLARKVIALVTAFLKALAEAWTRGREGLRRIRESIARFRSGLLHRMRRWPEARRLRRLATAADLPGHGDGLALGDRVAHWARLLPAPGRFGQVSRRSRWYQPAGRTSLASGQLPAVQDGVRWTMDRAVDGGPGPDALRHLAALRAAGLDVDSDVAERLSAAAPELGEDPHGTVRYAARYAETAGQRLRDLEAASAGGALDAALEVAAARVEAQQARQEAARLQQAYAAALPDAVLGTLSEVREMGPGTTATLVTTPNSDPDAIRALTDIARYVPRDWLSPTEARFIGARGGDAGAYDPRTATATIADLGDGGRRAAAHALLSHLQQHYPDLMAAEEAFHFTRTHRGRVGARRRTALDQLLARLFSDQAVDGGDGDLVPLGLATLFSGDWYEDDDLRAFLLGLLATR